MLERAQETPGYAELCRRFLTDSEDFSEENIEKSGIEKRFQNTNLQECIQEITAYILEVKERWLSLFGNKKFVFPAKAML